MARARALGKPTNEEPVALGKLRVLAVGVESHESAAQFPTYAADATRANDAQMVIDCFRDVAQLNAEKESLVLRTSATGPRLPTRNAIIGGLTELARGASAGDRILFYFSGHGERLGTAKGEELYLVPQDAYDAVPDALIPLARIEQILAESPAAQTLVVLETSFRDSRTDAAKRLPTSANALTVASAHASGVLAVLAAGGDSDAEMSPNPKSSAFAHYLARALRGQEPDALDERRRLTVPKLFAFLAQHVHSPIDVRGADSIVLGDFGQSILSAAAVSAPAEANEALAKEIRFEDSRETDVTEILTKIRNWNLSEPQIEHAANGALAEYLAPSLGKLVPILRRALGFSQGTVMVEGDALRFPGGSLEARFHADTKRSGRLVRTLTLDGSWFAHAARIPKVVETLGIEPEITVLRLRRPIAVASLIAGLESSSWTVVSELHDEVRAEKRGTEWTFKADQISVKGMKPANLFAKRGNGGAMAEAIALFAKS